MLTKFKKYLEPFVSIIAQPFLSINPNILTALSALFAGLFVITMMVHVYLLAGLFWIGVVFDAIDGYVARKTNTVTKFGAFFDSTMDRISDFFYLSAFGFAGFISWPVVSIAVLTTFLISYTKARGESLSGEKSVVEGIMQRTERLAFLFVCFLLFVFGLDKLGLMVYVLLICLCIVTFFQRMIAIRRILR